MVPNLANITKNYCFPKTLETVFGNIFYAKFLPFFEIQIANIGKESILHYFIKLIPNLQMENIPQR